MSILIKGIETPTSCDKCWALDDYGDYPRCRITEEQRGYNFRIREKRMDNCPLVPVPPHGRLIDADALYDHMREAHDKWRENPQEYMSINPFTDDETMVLYAPAVIPADPAEEGET